MKLISQDPVEVEISDNKIVLEGKVYYVHVVKAGQTLYSIARAYNLSQKEIVIENPGLTNELRIGQVLKIPSKPNAGFDVDTGELYDQIQSHVIQEGETVFSISRQYKISVDDIVRLNPELDINDIPIGTKISLSVTPAAKNERAFDEEGFLLHKVKRGETLWSISRFYDVPVREIKNVNKNLQWGMVRRQEIIRIPQSIITTAEIFNADSITEERFKSYEDEAVDEVPEAYTYEELNNYTSGLPGVIKIAYLIPFNYEKMEPLDSLINNVSSPQRRERIIEDYMQEKATPKSVSFLEFLEGSLLALDNISENGPSLEIRIYDTKRSMYHTRRILEDPDMQDMDLIIGPFYAFNLELANDFSAQHNIPLITPFHSSDSLLRKNPYLFQVTPSMHTESKKNAEYIARLYDKNIIFVHEGDSSQMNKILDYKQTLFNQFEKYAVDETVVFKEVILDNGDTRELIHALNPSRENLVVLPTSDEAFASQVATTLYYQLDSSDVELFGSSYWEGFKNIDITYIHALKLRISNCFRYDYTNTELINFLKDYRENYYREPEHTTMRGAKFAIVGYDISTYFISAILKYGKNFILNLEKIDVDETLSDYRFKRISSFGGYENTMMNYYLFDDGLEVDITSLPDTSPIHEYFRPATDDDTFYLWPKPDPDSTLHFNERGRE
ncbi:MAG TPA: LysM peptidoglycan-binding domain-containing protein [Bacteroidales bacterium]|nr:LysM peptidoglycan-binding domain-containing protein [Bacteroidales bacterium]